MLHNFKNAIKNDTYLTLRWLTEMFGTDCENVLCSSVLTNTQFILLYVLLPLGLIATALSAQSHSPSFIGVGR